MTLRTAHAHANVAIVSMSVQGQTCVFSSTSSETIARRVRLRATKLLTMVLPASRQSYLLLPLLVLSIGALMLTAHYSSWLILSGLFTNAASQAKV